MNTIDGLLAELKLDQSNFEDSLPPVELWSPDLSGDIDIRIDREGRWFHEGTEFTRKSLVKLFSSIIKKEGGEYFLVTPVEKWRIQVDVTPFFIKSVKQNANGLVMTTNVDNAIAVDKDHPLWVESDAQGQPLPLIKVQRNLNALISRNVFYQLVELAKIIPITNDATGLIAETLFIESYGSQFDLGVI